MTAQYTAPVEEDQARERSLRPLRSDGRLANEIAWACKIDCPCQPRLQRTHGFVHVLPVQVHPRFEAQRVARAEPARPDTRRGEGIPKRARARRWKDDLEAIFTGIAGAGDEVVVDGDRVE